LIGLKYIFFFNLTAGKGEEGMAEPPVPQYLINFWRKVLLVQVTALIQWRSVLPFMEPHGSLPWSPGPVENTTQTWNHCLIHLQ